MDLENIMLNAISLSQQDKYRMRSQNHRQKGEWRLRGAGRREKWQVSVLVGTDLSSYRCGALEVDGGDGNTV